MSFLTGQKNSELGLKPKGKGKFKKGKLALGKKPAKPIDKEPDHDREITEFLKNTYGS